MADFSLTTLFVAPVGQTSLPSTGSTQDLTPGQIGVFTDKYVIATAGTAASSPYIYIAQGRSNTYLEGSKRSDKIKGGAGGNVIEWYKVIGSPVAANQVVEIDDFNVLPGDEVTFTFRAHSSYIDTLYFNGLTRSVTIPAECLECGDDPCDTVSPETIVDNFLEIVSRTVPGANPDNISLNTFFTFSKSGSGATTKLVVEGKPLTKYGVPCDVAAFPHEYDRMWFDTYVYKNPDTTADFITADSCDIVAEVTKTQNASYPTGTPEEIAQLEKNFYSYQSGHMKHLYRLAGYNQTFESFVDANSVYTTYYIKFSDLNRHSQNWGDYISLDSTVIIAVPAANTAFVNALEAVLVGGLGAVSPDNTAVTTTTTSTAP